MSKYDQLKKKKDDAFAGAKKEIGHMHILADESRRVANVAHNAGEIITDLDKQFAAATKLNGKDVAFLFLATALQCTKWMLMPEFDFNFNAKSGGNKSPHFTANEDSTEIPEQYKPEMEQQPKKEEHYTWQQILLSPPPYLCDTSEIPEPESTLNKLLKKPDEEDDISVWGNHPLFGWVFGTLNILSRTVTLRDMRTYDVALDRESSNLPSFLLSRDELQVIPDPSISIPQMLSACYATFQEDPKRLFAAVAKQATRQFANSPESFGVAIPLLCEHSPDEIADDMRNAARWGKRKKDSWDEHRKASKEKHEDTSDQKTSKQHHYGEYTSKAFGAYESAQSVAGTASDTIDKAQSYLDSIEGMDTAKTLLDKARSAIEKAQEYMNKPMETFAEYTTVPGEYLDKTQNVINSSREYISEAKNYIKQACGIVGIISVDDGPLGKLFDEADNLLDGTADIANSIQELLSNPQNLLTKIEEFAEKGWNSFTSNELAKTIAKDIAILGLQLGISILINALIRALHTLCYNEGVDGDPQMYEVRTRKILSYSNVIASGSNIIYVALSKNLKKLDIGGIAVTIYRVVTDHRFIQDLKREFLSKQWYDIVMGDDEIYSFLDKE